jgi:TolA-binding protein
VNYAPTAPSEPKPGAPTSDPKPTDPTPNTKRTVDPKLDATKPTIVEPAKPDRAKQTAIELQFRKGWELLRAGKAREAAIELGAAADAMPESPLAADARYWQAVALIRAGQPRDAERVLVQFLDNAPKSLRRGRAAVLLGRVLAERGDRKSATAWFETAINDPDPAIANAARPGKNHPETSFGRRLYIRASGVEMVRGDDLAFQIATDDGQVKLVLRDEEPRIV